MTKNIMPAMDDLDFVKECAGYPQRAAHRIDPGLLNEPAGTVLDGLAKTLGGFMRMASAAHPISEKTLALLAAHANNFRDGIEAGLKPEAKQTVRPSHRLAHGARPVLGL